MDPISPLVDFVKNSITEGRNSRSSFQKPLPACPLLNNNSDGKGHVDIRMDSLTREPLPRRKWPICKIPLHIRHQEEEKAYAPRLVSIGPLHYKMPGLEFMEAQKLRLLDSLLERISSRTLVNVLNDAMNGMESKTRDFYAEDLTHIDSDSFTKMMLVDGCFVIELLRLGGLTYQGKLADDPIFATRWMPYILGVDLLLMENQLPLFILQKLYDLTRSAHEENDSLNNLGLRFFELLRPGKDALKSETINDLLEKKFTHLLALFHASFAPSEGYCSTAQEESCSYSRYSGKGWIYSAKVLTLCGLKFKKKSGNIFDLEFKKKQFKISQLFIDENTSIVLRNLLAHEQSDRSAAPHFTSLVVFLGNLLCTEDDARVLMKAGIIRQAENDEEEVVNFFNSIVKQLVFDMDKCYLHKLLEDVNTSSQSRWSRFRLRLRLMLPVLGTAEAVLGIVALVQAVLILFKG